MTPAQQAELDDLDKHITELRKTWSNVQIFVNRETGAEEMSIGVDHGSTIWMSRGIGNWFARFGQIKLWMIGEDEDQRLEMQNKEGASNNFNEED